MLHKCAISGPRLNDLFSVTPLRHRNLATPPRASSPWRLPWKNPSARQSVP
jgi:hypothetical protein